MRKKKPSENGSIGSPLAGHNHVKHHDTPASDVAIEEKVAVIHPQQILKSDLVETHDTQLDQRELLRVLTEVRNGNFTVRMPIDQIGVSGKICDALNEIIAFNERMVQEFTKAGNTIGKQGKLTQRIDVPNARGAFLLRYRL